MSVSVQGSEYAAAFPAGGADVLRRAGNTWERAINDWTRYLQAGRKSERTIEQRRWQIRRLYEAYPRRSPWRLDLDDLTRWLTGHGWGPETMKSTSAALRSFYGWAHDTGRCRRNPAAKLPSVMVGKHLPRPARDGHVAAVLEAADPRTRLMVMLAYWAGLRASEIARLRWDQIDDGHLHIRGKGDVARIVPLHEKLTTELAAWRDGGALAYRYHHGADVWVFPGQTAGGLHPRMVSGALSTALGPGLVGHQLRHAFATRVLDATGDLAATQDLLGHASPATTRIYARTSTRALRAAIDAL